MTPQESLLALAKAVYPDVDWLAHAYPQGVTGTPNRGEHPYNHVYIRFDPATNSEQAMEVLCWLLETNHEGKQLAVTTNSVRCFTYDEDCEDILCWNTWHKNTPASLRAAIVQAACRVVSSARPIAREIAMQQDAAQPFIRGKP